MKENQNREWKESWKDEYLKWICGFANAQGGKIYIGIRDDGTVVGVSDSKKLLEDIPNKIQTTMGIMADVNLLSENNRKYIEIVVSPSSYPVNYKGEYHFRSGCTKQQLRGSALTQFIREKTGLLWDAVPVDNIAVEDLDLNSLEIFRREAVRKNRMEKADLDISNEELLDHLDLMVDGKLKRAAIMLFYKKPGRMITGCYVKIGKFGKGSDLQYQDVLEGSLFSIADRVIDLIYTKYLKAVITYEHDVRVETFPFPREGVREAIYNALSHNNYARSVPIQIRIEDDVMYISNSCILPQSWTVETLMNPHKSIPFNPSIANVFYRAGYIEAWGRGIQKICESCREHGTPDPEYMTLGDDITVKFTALKRTKVSGDKVPNPQTVGLDVGLGDGLDVGLAKKILTVIEKNPSATIAEIAEEYHVTKRTVEREIKHLRERGNIVRRRGERHGCWEISEESPSRGNAKVSGDKVSNPQIVGLDVGFGDGLDVGLAGKILTVIEKNPSATMAEMAEVCHVTKRTVERKIKRLREQGSIVRRGGKRHGCWEISEESPSRGNAKVSGGKVSNPQIVGLDVGFGDGLDVGLAGKILTVIEKNPSATIAEMAEVCHVTKRTVEREIKRLRERGSIVRCDGKRYGYWGILIQSKDNRNGQHEF